MNRTLLSLCAGLFLMLSSCQTSVQPHGVFKPTLKISLKTAEADVSDPKLLIGSSYQQAVIKWTSDSKAWLVDFPGETPCENRLKVIQKRKTEVCRISITADSFGKEYKYVAYYNEYASGDPQVCMGRPCSAIAAAPAPISCVDFKNEPAAANCPKGAADKPTQVVLNEPIFFKLPDDGTISFDGSSPCDPSQTRITADTPYCTASKAGSFRYKFSGSGGTEYQVQVSQ